jgi:hypothetical protein
VSCKPGHPPRHADFEPGNRTALRHGSYSEQVIAQTAERVHSELLSVAPWCAEPRFAPALQRYLWACAREQLAHKALMTAPKLSPRLMESCTAAARLAWMMSHELGLTPAGHARLKVLVVDATTAEASLERLAEVGAEIRRARAVEATEGHDDGSPAGDGSAIGEGAGFGEREKKSPANGRVPLALSAPVPQPQKLAGNTEGPE